MVIYPQKQRKVNMRKKQLTKLEKQMLKLLMSYHKKFDAFGKPKNRKKNNDTKRV